MGKLEGKVAVITGAGSGMGRASALLFAAEGAQVVCADLSGQEKSVAAEIGTAAIAVSADVAKAEDVRNMIGATPANPTISVSTTPRTMPAAQPASTALPPASSMENDAAAAR